MRSRGMLRELAGLEARVAAKMIEIDKPLSRERRIETMAFYAVLAWEKEGGRPSLFPATGDHLDALPDVPPLDEAMADLERLFRTEPSFSQPNQSWRSLIRPDTVLDAAEKLSRPEFIEWIAGIFDLIDLDARAALFIALNGGSDAV